MSEGNVKKAWEAAFIKPIAKVMKDRGIAYLLITLRDDGKAAYVMEPLEEEECRHDAGHDLNGVGMWICNSCRADITPELKPPNAELRDRHESATSNPNKPSKLP